MGDTLNTLTAGIASGGIGAVPSLFGGGGSSGVAAPKPSLPLQTQNSNFLPQLQALLPASAQGNAPITDPSAILKAYTANIPALMNSAQNANLQTSGTATLPAISLPHYNQSWGNFISDYARNTG